LRGVSVKAVQVVDSARYAVIPRFRHEPECSQNQRSLPHAEESGHEY
jgi:hypothetical protein